MYNFSYLSGKLRHDICQHSTPKKYGEFLAEKKKRKGGKK